MNLKQVSYTVLSSLFIYSLSSAEPIITPSGSVQVTSEVNNGKSSFRTESNLSLEINFTDNVTGYIQATNESSKDQSSAQFHQAFVILANSKSTKAEENYTASPIFSKKTGPSEKEVMKIVRAESAKLFPEHRQVSVAKISNTPEKTKPNPSNTQIRSIQLASK